jgi:hypothetical protein
MPYIKFPHANKQAVEVVRFIAAWKVCFERYTTNINWRKSPMPRLNAQTSLKSQLEKQRSFSLDVLCRFLVTPAYRNTMLATNVFMGQNQLLLERAMAVNPVNGISVNGAKLTVYALQQWDALSEDERVRQNDCAIALLDSDVEVGIKTEILKEDTDPTEYIDSKMSTHPPEQFRMQDGEDRSSLVKKLVRWIHIDPFQPCYMKRPIRQIVIGWDQRLCAYFWPNPGTGYAETEKKVAPLHECLSLLARKLETGQGWEPDDGCLAVEFANQVLFWGGVPQNEVTLDKVRSVISNAVHGELVDSDAPMNSGWTKVAAFATAHLEGNIGRHPQVIWDSRVSTSIIHRLDRMLGARHKIARVLFPDLGIVIGRGGTRPRELICKWPIGYGKWSAQFAGSRVVKEIRDKLNDPNEQYPSMPLPGDGTGPWTIRGVEMVLIGDGY